VLEEAPSYFNLLHMVAETTAFSTLLLPSLLPFHHFET
jgi:hypothetical protein